MPCNDYSSFKKVRHYGEPLVIRQLEVNTKHYFDWAFLKIGAWNNVDNSSSGIYGGNFYNLREVDDSGYGDNRVYQSIRKDWIYETGVNYCSPLTPVSSVDYNVAQSRNQVFTNYNHNFSSGDSVVIENNSVYNGSYTVHDLSGSESFYLTSNINSGEGTGGSVYGVYNPVTPPKIYVDGTLRTTGESNYSHYINYPLGRVIFDDDQSTSTISADYSYRAVQTYISDDLPWFFEVQYDSLDPSNLHWTQNIASGDFDVPRPK